MKQTKLRAQIGTGLGIGDVFWIDYRQFIDNVQARLLKMNEKLKPSSQGEKEAFTHECPECKQQYSETGAYQNDFRCLYCDVELEEIENDEIKPVKRNSGDELESDEQQFYAFCNRIFELLDSIHKIAKRYEMGVISGRNDEPNPFANTPFSLA